MARAELRGGERLAVLFHRRVRTLPVGEQRFTRVLDLTIYTGFGGEEAVISRVLEAYPSRFPDMLPFAVAHRVALARTGDGIPVDIAFGGLPFEERMIVRSSAYDFLPERPIRTCGAEDLVVMKAFAGRDQDRIDIGGILERNRSTLAWDTILPELRGLAALKHAPDIVERLLAIRREIDPPAGAGT